MFPHSKGSDGAVRNRIIPFEIHWSKWAENGVTLFSLHWGSLKLKVSLDLCSRSSTPHSCPWILWQLWNFTEFPRSHFSSVLTNRCQILKMSFSGLNPPRSTKHTWGRWISNTSLIIKGCLKQPAKSWQPCLLREWQLVTLGLHTEWIFRNMLRVRPNINKRAPYWMYISRWFLILSETCLVFDFLNFLASSAA